MKRFFRGLLPIMLMVTITFPVQAFKMPEFKFSDKNKKIPKAAENVLKALGAGVLVHALAGPLNDFINTVMMNHGTPNRDTTKVVPIVTVGQGIEVGAAQVSGTKDLVDKVKNVVSVTTTFDKGKRSQVQALIPNSSSNPLQLYRVYGVGITAIVDYKL